MFKRWLFGSVIDIDNGTEVESWLVLFYRRNKKYETFLRVEIQNLVVFFGCDLSDLEWIHRFHLSRGWSVYFTLQLYTVLKARIVVNSSYTILLPLVIEAVKPVSVCVTVCWSAIRVVTTSRVNLMGHKPSEQFSKGRI